MRVEKAWARTLGLFNAGAAASTIEYRLFIVNVVRALRECALVSAVTAFALWSRDCDAG